MGSVCWTTESHASRIESYRQPSSYVQRGALVRWIARVHVDVAEVALEALAGATDGYTGADVKEVVLMGLKIALHVGKELSTKHRLHAIPEIRPLSQTDPERVAAMTEWLERHTKAAGASADSALSAAGNSSGRWAS
jgi:SpoVK/Ycf46/Vps4 family AAA+-type ATPase